MVIGGLNQERDSNIQSKVPWLGDLSYAGALFQGRQVVKSRSEIIVTLVPHVQPYTPQLDCRERHEVMQTQERLTYGPLCRNPRPYEARLADTFNNPKCGCVQPECREPLVATVTPTVAPTVAPAFKSAVPSASLPTVTPVRRLPSTNLPLLFNVPEPTRPAGGLYESTSAIPVEQALRTPPSFR